MENKKKQFVVIYEVVKQYRVIIEADTKEQAREKFEKGEYDPANKIDMEYLSPYDEPSVEIVELTEAEEDLN